MIEYTVKEDGNLQEWYLDGKLHREDGPAFIDDNYKEWWINDEKHREDGPAVIDGNYKEWYLNNVEYTEEEFLAKTKPAKEMTMEEVVAELGYDIKIKKG